MLSTYLDLAIGLIVAFLLLSLLVSGLNEGIVRLLSIRSKFLWAYLRDTMDGPDRRGRSFLPSGIRDVFTSLPFLRDPRPQHNSLPAPAVMSPLPEQEASAENELTERLYERVREIDHPKGSRTSIATLPPARFALAVMELASAEPNGVEGLLDKLKLARSPLHGHLQGIWESVQADANRFRQEVEVWFDAEMGRLTLLYRRYVRWVVAALGLILTLLFSMDSLEYGKTMLRDHAFREGVAAIAGGGDQGLDALKDRCTANADTADPYTCVTETLSSPALVKIFDNAVAGVAVPQDGDPHITWNVGPWWDRLTTPGHWPGFLVTFVALLFGASFWWDILRRLTGIRARSGRG
ncbi:hypothetical protein SAMN05421505_102335 [Sinosporangium album]|uniref:Uncharacterized protein n=1 Tax=Sinosporangium album TaxID=504805 RepID=A0A1G7SK12_9ACTN|nr:hypothetical protein [Sinosporangium album]SDG23214.1 hypothetical protein SAMN05421505_102335 [Sinosporangium album]